VVIGNQVYRHIVNTNLEQDNGPRKTIKIQSPAVSSPNLLFLKEVLKIKIIFVFLKNKQQLRKSFYTLLLK